MLSPPSAVLPLSSPLRSKSGPCCVQTLSAGAVRSWFPPRPIALHVKAGRVWVTLGGPYVGHANQLGDLFLEAGERLEVPAKSRVVMEAWMVTKPMEAVHFEWCESVEPWRHSHFAREVVAPSSDVLVALRAVAEALGRFVRGVFGFARLGWAGRGHPPNKR